MSKCGICGKIRNDCITTSVDFIPRCADCIKKEDETYFKMMQFMFPTTFKKRVCQKCENEDISDEAKYCKICGTKLGDE